MNSIKPIKFRWYWIVIAFLVLSIAMNAWQHQEIQADTTVNLPIGDFQIADQLVANHHDMDATVTLTDIGRALQDEAPTLGTSNVDVTTIKCVGLDFVAIANDFTGSSVATRADIGADEQFVEQAYKCLQASGLTGQQRLSNTNVQLRRFVQTLYRIAPAHLGRENFFDKT